MLLQLILNLVLMLGSTAQTIIGRPVLPDAAVHAVVAVHVRYRTYHFDLLISTKTHLCFDLARVAIEQNNGLFPHLPYF